MLPLSGLFFIAFLFQDAPSFHGTLAVDGKSMPVRALCARETEDPFDDKKIRIEVVVSAAPWNEAAGKTCQADFLPKNSTPVLVAIIESSEMTWGHGTLYANDHSYSYSFSGTDPVTKFEPNPASKPDLLTGRLFTNGDAKFANFPALNLDVTFSVPLIKVAPKSAPTTGAKALQHPATLAARRFLTAMSQANVPQIRANIVEAERPRFDDMMKSPDKAKMMPMMQEMAADALKMPAAEVAMRGETAEVVFLRVTGTSKENARFRLRQEQGVWRVTQSRQEP